MADAEDTWTELDSALRHYSPPCAGHASFTADSRTDEQRALCESTCARCLVNDLCGAYACAARVKVGFWAGSSYTEKSKTTDAEAVTPAPTTTEGIES